ncbi:hypothetical protein IKT18_00800 [Candidatus Saccharibacteria bacterium]|nr:hypothetical protein [Candidatus Saccharibacteria bacterium]
MSSKLLINVNDASSAVIPDTSAPDTGMFSVSHTDGVSFNTSMVLPIIGIAVLTIAIIAGTVVAISRRKKVNRFTTHTNKHLVAKLTTLSVVVLLGALGVLNADKLTNLVSAADDLPEEGDVLTLTASDIKVDVDLDDTAAFGIGTGTVSVNTTTKAGYTVMAYVDSSATDLKNETDKTSKSTISMLESLEPSALTENTWGIASEKPTDQTSAVFTGLPTSAGKAQTIRATHKASEAGEVSTFYYGAYVAPDTDFGTYSGVTITYIAIANMCNPVAADIEDTVCLQDFASPYVDQIVESMTPEATYTLMDKRDEKTYTIGKFLANAIPRRDATQQGGDHYTVWMTQNLDLDIDSRTTYTNEDTDLGYNTQTGKYETASWRPESSTITTAGEWGEKYCYSDDDCRYEPGYYDIPESYDPGDVYWNSRVSTGDDWQDYWRICYTNLYAPDCPATIPTSNYIANTGSSHYHLGNFYNWTAAVATNDSVDFLTNGNMLVEQSICPAGWTLPRIGYGEDSFNALWYSRIGNYDDETGTFDNISALWSEPLGFPTSGYYMGAIGSIGIYGGFWSSFSYGDEGVIGYGGFDVDGSIFPPYFHSPFGLSIRCVARPVSSDIIFD